MYYNYKIGTEFTCGGHVYRCTDVGLRVIVAICISDYKDQKWFKGPPYAVVETTFDECDFPALKIIGEHKAELFEERFSEQPAVKNFRLSLYELVLDYIVEEDLDLEQTAKFFQVSKSVVWHFFNDPENHIGIWELMKMACYVKRNIQFTF